MTAFKAAATEERAATFLIGGEAGVGKTRLVDRAGRPCRGRRRTRRGRHVPRARRPGDAVRSDRAGAPRPAPAARPRDARPRWSATREPALARLLPELAGRRPDRRRRRRRGPVRAPARHPASASATTCRRCSSSKTCTGPITRPATSSCSSPATCATRASSWSGRSAPTTCTAAIRCGRCSPSSNARAPRTASISLRFDRDEIAELIAAIRGEAAAADLVDSTFERSDGNAFFAEELLAAEEMCDDTLPDSLRDIVLARVDALSDAAQRALRVVAGHRPVPPTTGSVSAVAEIPEAELTEGLRDAVAHQVLVAEPDALAYRFRHALVYETVYDDLLPSERVRLHARDRRAARARPDWFDGDEQSLASELACHWDAAHDQRRALPGRARRRACGRRRCTPIPRRSRTPNAALTLWEHVADAAGADRPEPRGACCGSPATLADDCGQFRPRARVRRVPRSTQSTRRRTRSKPRSSHERIGRYMWYENYAPDDLLEHNRDGRPSRARGAAERRARAGARDARPAAHGRGPEPRSDRDRARRASRSRTRWAPASSRVTRTTRSAARSVDSVTSRPGRPSWRSRATSRSRPSRGATSPVPPRTRAPTCRPSTGTRRRLGDRARRCRISPAPRPRPRVRRVPPHQRRRLARTSSAGGTRWRSSSAKPTRSKAPGSTSSARAHAWATLYAGRGQFDAARGPDPTRPFAAPRFDQCRGPARVRDGRSPRAGVVGRSRRARSSIARAGVRGTGLGELVLGRRPRAARGARLRSRKTTPRSRPWSPRSTVGSPSPGGAAANRATCR